MQQRVDDAYTILRRLALYFTGVDLSIWVKNCGRFICGICLDTTIAGVLTDSIVVERAWVLQ